MHPTGRSWNQSKTFSTSVSTNILIATSSCWGFTTPQVLWKALKCYSVEVVPSPLNLGNFFLDALGKTLLDPRERGPIEFPHGVAIATGIIFWFVSKVTRSGSALLLVPNRIQYLQFTIYGFEPLWTKVQSSSKWFDGSKCKFFNSENFKIHVQFNTRIQSRFII